MTAAYENIRDREQSWNRTIADYLQKAARERKPIGVFSLDFHAEYTSWMLLQTPACEMSWPDQRAEKVLLFRFVLTISTLIGQILSKSENTVSNIEEPAN